MHTLYGTFIWSSFSRFSEKNVMRWESWLCGQVLTRREHWEKQPSIFTHCIWWRQFGNLLYMDSYHRWPFLRTFWSAKSIISPFKLSFDRIVNSQVKYRHQSAAIEVLISMQRDCKVSTSGLSGFYEESIERLEKWFSIWINASDGSPFSLAGSVQRKR